MTASSDRDWTTDFDHTDPQYAHKLWSVTSDLRARCPVASGQAFGGFKVLTTYEDVKRAYMEPQTFLSGQGATLPQLKSPFPAIPVETDGEVHRAFKLLVMKWLAAPVVQKLEPQLQALIDEQLDTFARRGSCDFVADFSYPLPAAVISMLMGLPRTEWRVVKDFFTAILTATSAKDMQGSQAAWGGLINYLAQQIEDRRRNPRSDMLTQLAQATVMGRPLTYEETVGIAYTLVTAGQDTTSNTIGMLTRHLAENPALKHRLIENPALIPEAIEEMLRWFGPVQTTSRVVGQDVVASGCPIKHGERVALLVGSANRDESQFERADQFDLDRADKRKHIAFGFGEHVCAGMALARLELRLVFERLLARLPDFELAGEPNVAFQLGMVYGLSSLPLRFTPEERASSFRRVGAASTMGPYSVRTVVAAQDTGGRLSTVDYTANEGATAEAPHAHSREDVTIVMVEGEVTFSVDGNAQPLKPGESLFIPRGTMYARVSADKLPARYLMTFTPGGFEQFFVDTSELVARRVAEGVSMPQIMPEITNLQHQYGLMPG